MSKPIWAKRGGLHEWLDEKKEVLDELDRQVAPIQAPGPDCQAAYRTYVGRKYSQLRLLESELETNTVRVEQLFKNVTNTIVQYPALSEKLGEQLNKLKSYWDQLKRFMCDRLEKMIQMHRAIIFQDGCIKLEQWLDTCVNSENVQTQGANKVTGAEELASNAGEKTPEGMETWTPLAACASLHEVNMRMKQAKLRLEETKEREKLLEELKEHARMLGYVSTKGSVNMEFIPNLDDLEMRYWLVRHKAEEDYAQLDAQMAYHQLLRDLEDERIWVQEKAVLAGNQDIGRSLMAIHQLICRHRLLIKEVSVRNERSKIMLKKADFIVNQWLTRSSVVEQAEKIKTDGTEVLITGDGVKFKILTKVLQGLSQATHDLRAEILELDEKLKQRSDLLDIGHQCFAHLSEFGELRNWLQETESVIMLESRASRDVATAKAELRKHANVEQRVNGLLASNVREFNAQTAKLLRQTEDQLRTIRDRLDGIRSEKGYKKSKGYLDDSKLKDHRLLKRQLRGQIKQLEKRAQVFQSIQSTIDREYAGLRDVCVEKRQRLEELLSLNIVYEEVYNLENWLHQQNILAAASNTGRNLQECLHLIHRFRTFADSVIGEPVETDICSLDMHAVEYEDDRSFSVSRRVKANPSGGTMRMRRALDMCRCLIRLRHSDAPHIAFWQDRLEEAWTDLNELIRTRMQQLTAAAHRHLYLLRCHEIHELIADKTKQLPKEVGNEFHIIMQQLSQQTVFEQEVHALELQVEWVRTTADNLLPMYAGKWATNLSRPKDKLTALMDSLNEQVRLRREHLQASLNYQKWMIREKELNSWIDGCGSALEQILQHAHGEDGELLDSVHEM
ncbi:unnamed protein product [Calicophoron daubneyi]|uniref:Uncharacterized protein n=1 Tax=Calicophoron daubneyi TaxID=300641 RepID=A0AAV2T788_CALDB